MKTVNMIRQILAPKYKIAAVFLVLAMFIGALLEIAALAMLMPLVTAFTDPKLFENNKYLKTAYDFSHAADLRQFIIIAAIILIVIYILKNTYNFAVFYAQSYFTMKLTLNITNRVYQESINKPYEDFLKQDNSEIISQIVRIADFGQNFLTPFFIALTEALVFGVLSLTILIIIPEIALASFALCVVIVGGFYFLTQRKIERYGKNEHMGRTSLLLLLNQTFAAVKELKLAKIENFFRNKVYEAQQQSVSASKRISDWGNFPRMLLETLTVVLAMSILIFLLMRNVDFTRIVVLAAFFLGAMFRLLPSISRLHHNLHWVKHNYYLFTLIYDSLALKNKKVENSGSGPFTFNDELDINNVSFSYMNGGGRKVLNNFNLKIKAHECVVFTGLSGCGKTTLIDLISGLLAPSSGSITVDGQDIRNCLDSWQKSIGYVPQDTILFNTTLKENIALGIPANDIDDKRIDEVLKLARIDAFVDSLPEKTDTRIGGSDIRLSGGQRQRIAIARALYRNPAILILDEATSALDAETESAFAESIRSLKGKVTIIMIAHREKMIEICDRRINL